MAYLAIAVELFFFRHPRESGGPGFSFLKLDSRVRGNDDRKLVDARLRGHDEKRSRHASFFFVITGLAPVIHVFLLPAKTKERGCPPSRA